MTSAGKVWPQFQLLSNSLFFNLITSSINIVTRRRTNTIYLLLILERIRIRNIVCCTCISLRPIGAIFFFSWNLYVVYYRTLCVERTTRIRRNGIVLDILIFYYFWVSIMLTGSHRILTVFIVTRVILFALFMMNCMISFDVLHSLSSLNCTQIWLSLSKVYTISFQWETLLREHFVSLLEWHFIFLLITCDLGVHNTFALLLYEHHTIILLELGDTCLAWLIAFLGRDWHLIIRKKVLLCLLTSRYVYETYNEVGAGRHVLNFSLILQRDKRI